MTDIRTGIQRRGGIDAARAFATLCRDPVDSVRVTVGRAFRSLYGRGRTHLPFGYVCDRGLPLQSLRNSATQGVALMHFFVLALRTPDFDAEVLSPHRAYLEALRIRGLLVAHGPFLDQSGGAYVIRADSLPEAEAVAAADPLSSSGAAELAVWPWDMIWSATAASAQGGEAADAV
ncbi:MAG: YciI family protein [Steroidobacteraceae bacterium]